MQINVLEYFEHGALRACPQKVAVVGTGTRVWAFAHVCNGAVIGDDCNLCDHTFFEKGVRLGYRVTI